MIPLIRFEMPPVMSTQIFLDVIGIGGTFVKYVATHLIITESHGVKLIASLSV